MSDAVPTENANRLHSLGGRVEEMCDRVEAAWKTGQRPRIEDHLGDTPEPERSALLRELLVLDRVYRDRAKRELYHSSQMQTARLAFDLALDLFRKRKV
jgi:hypothetical protein